ncbi:MAG TPA: hypothetical protein VF437_04075 [Verrucomicrobiae bacterium]
MAHVFTSPAVSRSETMMVAVGFISRTKKQNGRVAERRLKMFAVLEFQPSLRDAS